MRFSEEQLIVLATFTLVGGLLVWFFLSQGGSAPPSAVLATPQPTIKPQLCGQVIRGSCEMLIKEKTAECNRAIVEGRVTARLARPSADEACIKARLQLAESCPPECLFDYATIVAVPGSVQVDFFPEQDDEGKCFVRARRTVTMQGKCVDRDLAPASFPSAP